GHADCAEGGTVRNVDFCKRPTERIVWYDAIQEDGTSKSGASPWFASINNHHNDQFASEGGNYGMLDGHVEWRQTRFGPRSDTDGSEAPIDPNVNMHDAYNMWYAWQR